MSQEEHDRKSEWVARMTAINYSKLLGTLIGAGYIPEQARPAARLILALVGITMLARSL